MAWWNKPAGTLTPSVGVDRIAAWFTSYSYTFDLVREDNAVFSGFNGVSYMFKVVNDRILVVNGRYMTALPTDESTVDRARSVARRVADSRVMPAIYLIVDEHGLALYAEAASSIGAGLNDEQLGGVMDFIIGGIETAVREVLEELGQPSPSQRPDGIGSTEDAQAAENAEAAEGAGGAEDAGGAEGAGAAEGAHAP